MYEEERIRWSRNYGAALASVNTVLFFIFGLVLYRIHVHIRTSFDAESLRSAGARIPMDQQDGNIYAANYSNNYSGSEGTVLGHVDLSTRSAAMPQPSLESYMGTQESYMGQPRGVRAQSVMHTPPRGHGCVMVRARSIYTCPTLCRAVYGDTEDIEPDKQSGRARCGARRRRFCGVAAK